MNINKVTVVGRLVRDPETKALPSGIQVTSFSVATSRNYNSNGEKREDTEFHNIVVFGKQAEAAGAYLVKGQYVGINGRLQTRSWEKDGSKHYRTEIIADTVQFGPKADAARADASSSESAPQAETRPDYYPADDINPEDIPF